MLPPPDPAKDSARPAWRRGVSRPRPRATKPYEAFGVLGTLFLSFFVFFFGFFLGLGGRFLRFFEFFWGFWVCFFGVYRGFYSFFFLGGGGSIRLFV